MKYQFKNSLLAALVLISMLINAVGVVTTAYAAGTVSLDYTQWDFHGVEVGDSSSQTFTLTNNHGTDDLEIGSLSIGGDASFTLSEDNCSSAIVSAVGGTCTFDVTFAPTATGFDSGWVTIPSDAAAGPAYVNLDGEGEGIDITDPVLYIDSTPDDPSNSTTATFTFSADETVTFWCQLNGAPVQNCSPGTITYNGLIQGAYTFTVTARDTALNESSESYTWDVDLLPTVLSVVRASPDNTKAATVDFTVTFSEDVTGVDAADFTVVMTGVSGASVTAVTPVTADVYTVTVGTGKNNGTLGLNVNAGAEITDLAGNALAGGFTGEVYTIIKTAPKPSVPGLVAPANGVLLDTLIPTLDWKDSTPAAHHYRVQVATSSTFSTASLVVNEVDVLISTFALTSDLEPGVKYYWRVRAMNIIDGANAWSAVRSFKTPLEQTTLVAPADFAGLVTDRTTFEWNPVAGATKYQLQVATTSGTLLVNTTVKGTEYVMPKDLPQNQEIAWHVRAQTPAVNGPWSETRFFLTGNPATVPVLVSPKNNALLKNYIPGDWKDAVAPSGTSLVGYEIQIDDNPEFATPLEDFSLVSQYTPLALDFNTKYYWRVRSVNDVGGGILNFSAWSTVRSFRVIAEAPTLLPVAANGTNALRPIFDWEDATGTGAVTYTIQVSKGPNFGTLLMNKTVTASTFSATKDLPTGKTIYWRVRVNGANGPSAWTTADFTTPLPVP